MMGGQVGVVGHLNLPDGTQVGAQSGVSKAPTQPYQALRGSPAQPLKKQLKMEAAMRSLPELLERLQQLEQEVAELRNGSQTPQEGPEHS
jgi:UDP-3-O-[3-hydroxymyristoyl] glucosamine N-acyltransferase